MILGAPSKKHSVGEALIQLRSTAEHVHRQSKPIFFSEQIDSIHVLAIFSFYLPEEEEESVVHVLARRPFCTGT
jgi:hypothetical protein